MKLVPGDAQQIAADGLHIDRHLAHRLDGIGVEVDVGLLRDGTDLCHRLQRSDLIVGHHDADQPGIWPHGAPDILRLDHARAIYRQKGDLDAAVAHAFCRMKHGVMLDGAGDQVISRLQHAGERQIVALRAAAGEHNLRRPAAQQGRHLFAGALDRTPGALTVEVNRGGIPKLLRKPRTHGREHLGSERRGGIGIHVNAVHG